MRRISAIATMFLLVMASVLAGTAWATGSPHYVSVSGSQSGTTLKVDYKVAGFGGAGTATVTLTFQAACAATGKGNISAAKFKEFSTSSTLQVLGEGAQTGTISLTVDCPGNQVAVIQNAVLTVRLGSVILTATSADGLSWTLP